MSWHPCTWTTHPLLPRLLLLCNPNWMKLVRFGWLPLPLCCLVWFSSNWLVMKKLVGALLRLVCFDLFGSRFFRLSLNLPQFDCFSSHFILSYSYVLFVLRKIVCTLCTKKKLITFSLYSNPKSLPSPPHSPPLCPFLLFSTLPSRTFNLNPSHTPSVAVFSLSSCLPSSAVMLWPYCRTISSTWASWGCSGRLVSSSCWGREKPSASCCGPSFSPSRFTPNHAALTQTHTHTSRMYSQL